MRGPGGYHMNPYYPNNPMLGGAGPHAMHSQGNLVKVGRLNRGHGLMNANNQMMRSGAQQPNQ